MPSQAEPRNDISVKKPPVVGSGETIYVQNDAYNEQVTLTDKHDITLTGWNSGSGKPIIDGTDITFTCCGETTSALLQINDSTNNLVWGLTDKDGQPTCCLNVTRAGNNGVLKDGAFENIYVANNTMLSNGVCINVVNMDTSELENLTIENNIVDVDAEETPNSLGKRFIRISG